MKYKSSVQLLMRAPDRFHTMRLVSTASENADVAVGFTKGAFASFSIFTSSRQHPPPVVWVCTFASRVRRCSPSSNDHSRSSVSPALSLRVMFVFTVCGQSRASAFLAPSSDTVQPNLIHTRLAEAAWKCSETGQSRDLCDSTQARCNCYGKECKKTLSTLGFVVPGEHPESLSQDLRVKNMLCVLVHHYKLTLGSRVKWFSPFSTVCSR